MREGWAFSGKKKFPWGFLPSNTLQTNGEQMERKLLTNGLLLIERWGKYLQVFEYQSYLKGVTLLLESDSDLD